MGLTISIAQGFDISCIVGKPMYFWATLTNTGANAATLNSCSVYSPQPGVTFEQPNFLTSVGAVNQYNPSIAASNGTLAVRFSATFFMPNASGPSPQSPTGSTAAVNQPAWPVSGYFQLYCQGQITDTSGVVSYATGALGLGVLSEVQNVPRPEGGALDFRQGSNILGLFPGWP